MDRIIDTQGGTVVTGLVCTNGGDFIGRDQIDQLIQTVEKFITGTYVEHQEITTNVFTLGPGAVEAFANWFNRRQGLEICARPQTDPAG